MPRSEKGFTLLEVLVSLAILSGVLVMCYRVMSGAIEASGRSEQWEIATLLGEARLRETLAGFPETGDTDGKFPEPDDAYAWRQAVVETLFQNAREVHVTVSWAAEGREESITISGVAVK